MNDRVILDLALFLLDGLLGLAGWCVLLAFVAVVVAVVRSYSSLSRKASK